MLLQTVALASLWNDKEAKSSDLFVAFSILNSVFSVSWETMSALDRSVTFDKQRAIGFVPQLVSPSTFVHTPCF